MSSSLEKLVTTSEKTNVNVALSPGLSPGKSILSELVKVVLSVTEKVKELTVGRRVSTSKFEVVTEVPGFPTWSYQLAASVIVLLSTSILVVGVKIPLQMVPSPIGDYSCENVPRGIVKIDVARIAASNGDEGISGGIVRFEVGSNRLLEIHQ